MRTPPCRNAAAARTRAGASARGLGRRLALREQQREPDPGRAAAAGSSVGPATRRPAGCRWTRAIPGHDERGEAHRAREQEQRGVALGGESAGTPAGVITNARTRGRRAARRQQHVGALLGEPEHSARRAASRGRTPPTARATKPSIEPSEQSAETTIQPGSARPSRSRTSPMPGSVASATRRATATRANSATRRPIRPRLTPGSSRRGRQPFAVAEAAVRRATSSRTTGADLGAEELDRAHDLGVRQRADAELQQEAVVAEDLVLEEDLLGDLAAGCRRSSRRAASREASNCGGSSAASRARGRSGPSSSRSAGKRRRRPPASVSAMKPCELMLSGAGGSWPACCGGAAVQLGERREALGQAADDRERHRQPERAGADRPTAACRRPRPRPAADPAPAAGRRRELVERRRGARPPSVTRSDSRSASSSSSFSANSSS